MSTVARHMALGGTAPKEELGVDESVAPRCEACRFWREVGVSGIPIIGQAAVRRGVCDKLTGKDSKLSLITNNTEARFAVMTVDDFGCVQFGAREEQTAAKSQHDGSGAGDSSRSALVAEVDRLQTGLETERMRTVACGVAALGNTDSARADRITCDSPYWSASYGDVCAAVDREMSHRAEVERLRQLIDDRREDERSRD